MSGDDSLTAEAIQRFQDAGVLVVGDVMLDRFVSGEVERISPEAPIPVLKVTRDDVMLGGAGNVARNLASLGARVEFVSVVGDDQAGRDIEDLFADLGIAPALITDPDRQTGIKSRFVSAGQQILRADRETIEPISDQIAEAIFAAVEERLDHFDVLVLSDYGKGVLSDKLLRDLAGLATRSGKQRIVDPKGSDYARYSGPDVITPNRKELSEVSIEPLGGLDAVERAARKVCAENGIDNVIATLGPQGMLVVPGEGEVTALEARAQEVFDVSGAGDTVVATLAAALAAKVPLSEAAGLANVAAGLVVAKVGTAAVTSQELDAALAQEQTPGQHSGLLSRDDARSKVAAWHGRGLTVGFTNGCFDLLHPGHVSLLDQARAACDRLVVGLNSDASVRRLGKGDNRPVNAEIDRAAVLAALASVDAVVIFDEDTPYELIKALKPNVLVKGADYTIETVVGADLVTGWGGRVVLADLVPGQSTTAMVARMNEGS
ncbi:MAG: D-glycero-beta-D-manno-heptose-7-phosphate kinase [Magnetovibrionaceae bacterium]